MRPSDERKRRRRPEGALARFAYDSDSVRLPARKLVELSRQRARQTVIAATLSSGSACVLAGLGDDAWPVIAAVVSAVMVGTIALAYVLSSVIGRARRAAELAAVKRRRAEDKVVAAISVRFIVFIGALSFVTALVMYAYMDRARGGVPSTVEPATSLEFGRFTTPDGRCSAEMPGQPLHERTSHGTDQWRVRVPGADFVLFESDPSAVGIVGLPSEQILERMILGELEGFRRAADEFHLIASAPIEGSRLPGHTLRYTFRMRAEGALMLAVKRFLVMDDRTCAAYGIVRADADTVPIERFTNSLQAQAPRP